MPERYPAHYWHKTADGRIQCDLCPRDCKLREGQRGACFVRMRESENGPDDLWAFSGFCIDPIEKKPLNHFYPGSSDAVLRHGRLQPRLQVLPELGYQQDPRHGQADGPASPEAIAAAPCSTAAAPSLSLTTTR